MRQGNGTDLLGMNDPRSATIGVIYVAPKDDRKSVLAAILTQEKLSREQIVIVLPNPNNAFQRPQDFDDLKDVRRRLQGELIFIAPKGPGPAEFARQRQFPVYESLEVYTQVLRDEEDEQAAPEQVPAKKRGLFGWGKAAAPSAAAAAAAAANARRNPQPLDTLDEDEDFEEEPVSHSVRTPSAAFQHPMTPTPNVSTNPQRSAIDDDDDLGPTSNPGANIAAAGLGYTTANRIKRYGRGTTPSGNLDDEDMASTPDDQSVHGAHSTNATGQNNNPSSNPGGPGIIDLQPVNPKGHVGSTGAPVPRNTLKLNEAPVPIPANTPSEFEPPFTPPPTHGANKRRRTGSMATAAMGAGAFAAGSAIHSGNTGSQAALGTGANAAQRPASGVLPPQRPNRVNRGRRRPGLLLLLLLLLLLILLVVSGFWDLLSPTSFRSMIAQPLSNIMPIGGQPAATVTVMPNSRIVKDSYVIQAVTTNPKVDQLQVSLQNLKSVPAPQTRTITGTGHTQTDPAAATGSLTFFNGSTNSTTIVANTAIPGANGISYAPDSQVRVPAGTPANGFGQVTVPAHAVTAGTRGNIGAGAAFSQKPCCVVGGFITVSNETFTGGQNSQDYTFVKQGDVDAVVTPLVASLSLQASNDFKKQLTANQQLVDQPNCINHVSDTPQDIGDRGRNITSTTVTVSASCTGMAYDKNGAQKVAQDRLQNKATTDPGAGYVLVGTTSSQIVSVTKTAKSINLLVNAQGTWAYQWSDAQKAELARQLAGKKVADAQHVLTGQKGIQNATITSAGKETTLPSDPTLIKIDVQTPTAPSSANGSNGNPATGGSNTPPVNGPESTPTFPAGRGLIPTDTRKG